MLETLNKYIDEQSGDAPLSDSLWSQYAANRRFKTILVVSAITHLIFYATIIQMSRLAMRQRPDDAAQRVEMVKVTDVAPPLDRFAMRSAPESAERADLNRLQFDPNRADDQHLLSRSPKPATARGAGGHIPTAADIERVARAQRGAGQAGSANPLPRPPQPPTGSPIQINRLPQPDAPALAQAPASQSAPAPPAPKQSGSAAANLVQEATQGTRRGEGSQSNALGLENIQGQYIAYVRTKVIKVHRQTAPLKWIEDTLNEKVSAVFSISIRRDGRILSAQMFRSTGYSRLDDLARQAIYMASPFEGFPQDAGDKITLTVTISFDPNH